ncbi:enoyl-CoA hydratase/isomerase family protein [Sphingopyxis sp. JAI128]|uniref:enoyl-CoA hydratase/isomerase family protein n=1 Tax=Sphingopyxis sp. JAI128 TaxID=2723066 RepID=UPI001619D103|nr:enoyl-CoA hydratase/isomerase family protein [Sphingopyxis sp. JAI128]MBB6426863.1 2-(1,2-epoxy-1,2-dihydrophenyl)acetyl-CoA isomerase [Sphingopyxis sp. JAI128]
MDDIRIERSGAVGLVIMARAEANNSSRPQTLREICEAVDELTADETIRAIILAADGKHFSAGADFAFLDDLTRMDTAAIRHQVYTHFQGAARRLYHCPKPTIALVQGAAVTVGCELALACDFRIVADGAFFQESWVKLGIMPPLGGTYLLPRLIGMTRAADMCLRGRAVKAEEALAIGLATELVAPDALRSRGLELADELARAAPLAYSAIKTALRRGGETSMDAEWSANLPQQALLLTSADFREGLAAVRDRRPPEFGGT